jgi:hypothetical protein
MLMGIFILDSGEQKIKYADTPAERAREARSKEFFTEGNGYMILQATRPQTIGYSLADSPSGLLAYLAEKLLAWSDNYPWTDDESEMFIVTRARIPC